MFHFCSNHFEWADDTVEAARAALAQNQSSHSGFISRQVASYVDRFRSLTVPELRDEAVNRNLKKTGKKKELLFRLAIWVRDEIAKSVKEDNVEDIIVSVDENDSSSDDDSASSTEELEVVQGDRKAGHDLQVGDCFNDSKDTTTVESDDLRADDQSSYRSDRLDFEEEDSDMSCKRGESKFKELSLEDSLQTVFGHAGFRDGQEWAIRRCLSQEKSLLVAPTGFGKSLCYALPAAMMDGVSVVVSPLVSLIQVCLYGPVLLWCRQHILTLFQNVFCRINSEHYRLEFQLLPFLVRYLLQKQQQS